MESRYFHNFKQLFILLNTLHDFQHATKNMQYNLSDKPFNGNTLTFVRISRQTKV